MIRKLQIKFVAIIMAMMTIVMLVIVATINLTMYRSTNMQTFGMMERIAQNNGYLRGGPKEPRPADDHGPVPQTNFSVKLNEEGTLLEIISDRQQNYTEEEVAQYLQNALADSRTYGTTDTLKFLVQEKPYGRIVVFLDNSLQTSATARLFWITFFVGIGSLIVLFFVSLYLSAWAIHPVKKAYEAQKRFVADASHELKTPLTIISANADVLASDVGENKWLGFIQAEAIRMSELVNNLLYLAKSDAAEDAYSMKEFDLSNALMSAALPFESICYESHKKLTFDVTENILCHGDEGRLMQVVVILLDNAVKNAAENGEISISLSRQSGKKLISVYNSGNGLSPEDKNKIFDRFYRGDNSRDRQTGGYGLGLSIAKSIIDAHKGKITVESEQGKWVKFTISL